MSTHTISNPFSFSDSFLCDSPFHSIVKPIGSYVEKGLGMKELDSLYHLAKTKHESGQSFYDAVLQAMDCSYACQGLENIPQKGGAIIVSNHPFGGLEGVVMGSLLGNIRKDFTIMANSLLSRIPEFHDTMIFVNPFGGDQARINNLKGLRESIEWVKNGGILAVFPAGEVSHFHPSLGQITDPYWSSTITRIAKMTGAPIIPMFINGTNSTLFQAAGLLHPRLRTILLPKEYLKRKNSSLQITIGKTIQPSMIRSFMDDSQCTNYIRQRTYLLQYNHESAIQSSMLAHNEIDVHIDPRIIQSEFLALPTSALLAESGEFTVYQFKAEEAPNALREIGRLRELTFRQAGEGTGKSSDLDQYDADYIHLALVHKQVGIIGGYRIGQSDVLLEKYGKKGLYTHSLFKYKKAFIEAVNPALELGRAFIHPEYQKSFIPLQLLWKGIGTFICNNPQYRYLFGCVSISNDYTPLSKNIMIAFLREHCFNTAISKSIKPRNKYKTKKVRSLFGALIGNEAITDNIDAVNSLIIEIEQHTKGIPVLIRQYLKLNGKILGFNVDSSFSNVVDCLILVDLLNTDIHMLSRYFGEEGARYFRDFQLANTH